MRAAIYHAIYHGRAQAPTPHRSKWRSVVCAATGMLMAAGALGAQSAALSADSVGAVTRAQLERARDGVWRAWFASDSAALSQLLPAAVAAGSPGDWESRQATLAAARRFVKGAGRLIDARFDSTHIRLRGDVAVLQSRYTLVLEQAGSRSTQRGIATEIFVREHGRWTNPFWYLE